MHSHARIRKVLSEGSTSDNVFFLLLIKGREDPNTTKSDDHYRPASETVSLAGRWGPSWNAGLAALWLCRGSGSVLLKNYILVIFQVWGGFGPLIPLWIRAWLLSGGLDSLAWIRFMTEKKTLASLRISCILHKLDNERIAYRRFLTRN